MLLNLGWEQERLLQTVKKLESNLIGVHSEKNSNCKTEIANLTNLDEINKIALKYKPKVVISDQCDFAQYAAAFINSKYELPGIQLEGSQLGINKFLSRKKSLQKGLKIPKFYLCYSHEEAINYANKIGYPLIIKPVDSRGSIGVKIVKNKSDIKNAVFEALLNSQSRLCLIEEYIEGENIIIEGYNFPSSGYKTLAIGIKTTLKDLTHIHTSVYFPNDLGGQKYANALLTNENVVSELGLKFGMTSGEYIIDKFGEVWLIEIANRGGGVLISSHIVPLTSGIDTTLQLTMDSLQINEDLSISSKDTNYSAYLGYFVLKPGNLKLISGFEKLDELDDVVSWKYWGKTKGLIKWPKNATERQGMFIVKGKNKSDIFKNAKNVYKSLNVEYHE